MKASEMIARVSKKHDHSMDPAEIIAFINTLEENVYSQIVLEPYEDKMDLVKDQDLYELDGFIFEEIEQLKVNGTAYTLGSAFIQADRTYYKKNGMLCLKPVPTLDKTDGIEIIRRWKPDPITEDDYEDRDLLLPKAFEDAYEYYIRMHISFEQKDAAEANAHGAMYNGIIDEYELWYMKQQPDVAAYKTNTRWRK